MKKKKFRRDTRFFNDVFFLRKAQLHAARIVRAPPILASMERLYCETWWESLA